MSITLKSGTHRTFRAQPMLMCNMLCQQFVMVSYATTSDSPIF